jgi:hypothetical protein
MRRRGRRHPTIRNVVTLEDALQKLRNSPAHVGMGSITLTMDEQEELCDVVKKQMFNTSVRCEQLMAFCQWIVEEKGGRIEGGKESDIVWQWANG